MSLPIYATAWLSAVLFFCSRLRLCGRLDWWHSWARRIGQTGCIVLWIHILMAYALAHEGSHRAAVEHVAERTQQTIGVRSGLGIYANFAAAIVWSWLAFSARPSIRNSPVRKTAEIFLWLMWISASIAFAQLLSAIVFGLIAILVLCVNLYLANTQRT